MTKDYSRSLELLCPTCAGSSFAFEAEIDEAIRIYKCAGCGGEFDHSFIMASNSSRIGAEIEAMGQEVLGDAIKKLKKSFSNNKFIKIK